MYNTLSSGGINSKKKEKEFHKRNFTGCFIPVEILDDSSLSFFQKFLFAEIDALDGEEGCYASNGYLASIFKVSERTIKSGISALKKRGYIYQESFDGRRRILRSCMREFFRKRKNVKDKFDTSRVKFSGLQGCPKMDLSSREDLGERDIIVERIDKKNTTCPTNEASFVCDHLLKKRKEINPKAKDPFMDTWLTEMRKIIKNDQRTSEDLIKVIDWAYAQSGDFWPVAIQNPYTLRKLFDRAWAQMHLKNNQQKSLETLEKEKQHLISHWKKWVKDKIETYKIPEGVVRVDEYCVWINNKKPIGYLQDEFYLEFMAEIEKYGKYKKGY